MRTIVKIVDRTESITTGPNNRISPQSHVNGRRLSRNGNFERRQAFFLRFFANIPNSTESGIIFARLAYVKPLIPGTMLIAFGSIFRCLWQI